MSQPQQPPANLSASYSVTLRIKIAHEPGMLAKVTAAIGEAGGLIGAVDIVSAEGSQLIRDIAVSAHSSLHGESIAKAVSAIEMIELISVTDRTFQMHQGGKIAQLNKHPLETRDDLSRAYTPGVARVCTAIHEDKSLAYEYTIKSNYVAVVSDGTAVLGLGDIGPEAAMPVMEGKAMLFKKFADIDAFPLCLDTKGPDEIVAIVRAIAPGFGGINLEDISSPRCFEIEKRLKECLDIPVFHDDSHGTAVVVLAALFNALRVVGKTPASLKVAITGTGAAGIAVTKILLNAGVVDIVGCDRQGAISTTRADYERLSGVKRWYAEHTNPRCLLGSPREALVGADLFIGLSGPGVLEPEDLRVMNDDAIVFAMANPTPEVIPEEAAKLVRIIATGRSDYPNQINNVLCFPGIFRGALDAGATRITEGMKLAAAYAIAAVIPEEELAEDYIVPSVFNDAVAPAVAKAVAAAARSEGVIRSS